MRGGVRKVLTCRTKQVEIILSTDVLIEKENGGHVEPSCGPHLYHRRNQTEAQWLQAMRARSLRGKQLLKPAVRIEPVLTQ